MQRATQWGQDSWARAFGVSCSKAALYAYLACSIRNRIEVWQSQRFWSPMEGVEESGSWKSRETFHVKRPTKLIDGSRGGQAFMCGLLRPENDQTYSIDKQAKFQLLSVMLVAASLMSSRSHKHLEKVMQEEFDVGDKLGGVFHHLLRWLILANVLIIGLVASIFYALWFHDLFGTGTPYLTQVSSSVCWAVGAIGLLMIGGNPRVEIVHTEIPTHVQARLRQQTHYEFEKVTLDFGSIHGSVFTPDQGYSLLSGKVVRDICGWDLRLKRNWQWHVGLAWCGFLLILSIVLQIAGVRVATIWSEVLGVIILLITSVARGSGVSGSEEWMIPQWKRRKNTKHGAKLLGEFKSREESVSA